MSEWPPRITAAIRILCETRGRTKKILSIKSEIKSRDSLDV